MGTGIVLDFVHAAYGENMDVDAMAALMADDFVWQLNVPLSPIIYGRDAARAELEKANARFLLAIRAKLSPEQWKELKAARAERMEHRGWRDRRDEGKPQGPPPPAGPGAGPQGMLNEIPPPDGPGPA